MHLGSRTTGGLHFVLTGGRVYTSPSAAGKAITGTATNGYRFWSVPDEAPRGQQARQKSAAEAAAAADVDATPSATNGARGAGKSTKLIERAKSQKDVPEGSVRYFCSSCMRAFAAEDAGRGKVPERCPEGHSDRDAV